MNKNLSKKIGQIESLISKKDYFEALRLVLKTLKEFPQSTRLLLMKSTLLQLQDDTYSHELGIKDYFKEIEKTLEYLLSLDEKCPEVLVEQAYFNFVHKGKNKEAQDFFLKALELSNKQLIEIYIGLIKVNLEEDNLSKAKEYLNEAKRIFGNIEELSDVEADFE